MNGIDAVLSASLNPYTSGVAKFNVQLATRLHVPCVLLGGRHRHALISAKFAELAVGTQLIEQGAYSLFLHDQGADSTLLRDAEYVYAANPTIANAVRSVRSDVIDAWCPSLVAMPDRRPLSTLTVLTFGFAHKQQQVLQHYQALRRLLAAHGEPYTILVSTGVHDGHPWDETLEQSARAMRDVFGAAQVDIHGYLSDAALDREIRAVTCCAVFYHPAWRANNTTAWAVLERRTPLITNGDAESPQDVNGWYDITRLTTWPTFDGDAQLYQDMGRQDARDRYGWDRLVTLLRQGMPCVR